MKTLEVSLQPNEKENFSCKVKSLYSTFGKRLRRMCVLGLIRINTHWAGSSCFTEGQWFLIKQKSWKKANICHAAILTFFILYSSFHIHLFSISITFKSKNFYFSSSFVWSFHHLCFLVHPDISSSVFEPLTSLVSSQSWQMQLSFSKYFRKLEPIKNITQV